MAAAAACDSGSATLFEDVVGVAGAAGSTSGAGKTSTSGASSTAGSDNGGSSNAIGGALAMGGTRALGGTPATGGTPAVGGTPATGGVDNTGGMPTGGSGENTGGQNVGGDPAVSGAGEAGAPTRAEGGMAGDTSTAGTGSDAGQTGSGGANGCGGNALAWKPRASNVMFLIDRSGTMFDQSSQPWVPVRDAALPVIDSYDAALNIGFIAMTGEYASCPLLDEVGPATSNYAPIAAKYTALAKPAKGESPFMLALTRAQELLDGAPDGEAYVIMVVDGEPDFCNDGNDVCPIDSVVARIQTLKAAGITTLVAGLPIYLGADAALYAAALQSYANAGAGLPAASVGDTATNIYYQCNQGSTTPPSWKAEFDASGKPAMQALGTYSANPGSAPVTVLNPTDAASLTASFTQLFGRTQSCSFEASGGSVTLAEAGSGVVKLDGTLLPYDATNGWHLESESVLELVGSACDALRASGGANVTIDFPCSAVGD